MDNLWENHKEFLKNNKLVLKTQQRFRSKIHNVFTEEVNKIALRANNDKGIQLFNSIETDAYVTKENIKEPNPNWLQIPDHWYRLLIIGGSGSREINSLFNPISHQPDIYMLKIHMKQSIIC